MGIAIPVLPIGGQAPLSKQIARAYPCVLSPVAFGSIPAAYGAVAYAPTADRSFVMLFLTNTTNEDLFFSYDGVNDNGYVQPGQTREFNFMANRRVMPIRAIYVRYDSAAPTSGKFIFEGYV